MSKALGIALVAVGVIVLGIILIIPVMGNLGGSNSSSPQVATMIGTLKSSGIDTIIAKTVYSYNFDWYFTNYHTQNIGDTWTQFLAGFGLKQADIGITVGQITSRIEVRDTTTGQLIYSNQWTDPTSAQFNTYHQINVPNMIQGRAYTVAVTDVWGNSKNWTVSP